MRIILLFLATLISFNLAAAEPPTELPLNVGDTAPDWTLENREGDTVSYYEESDGKVSVVLFWSTTSPYSKTLLPHLEAIYRKYRSKGLKFYAIDVFEDGKVDPVEFYDTNEYSFTMLKEGDSVAKEYDVRGLPGLFVVDKNKQIVYKRPGGVSDVLVAQNVNLRIKQALAKSRK